MKKRWYVQVAATASIVALAAACGSSGKSSTATTASSGTSATTAASGGTSATTAGSGPLTASSPGVSATTIKIGYITSITGVASSTFADGPGGAEAAIDAANAAGGVDGRKLQLVTEDDESSPTGDATAAQELVQGKGVYGIVDYSPLTFGGAPYLSKQKIPVTGFGFDGPEWAEPQSTNMFSWSPLVDTPIQGVSYAYTNEAEVMKAAGVTKLAGFGYATSNSAQTSIHAILTAANALGIKTCYENESIPFGGVDFTAEVLAVKAAGCNGVVGSFVDASDLALSLAVKQAGLTNVKQMYFTGYDSTTLSTAADRAAFAGALVAVSYNPDSTVPAVKTMFANLEKYDSSYKAGSIPDLGLYGSYVSTQEMIDGLKAAGRNPTRASFITNFRSIGNYNMEGLLPTPIPFTKAGFGTKAMLPATECGQFASISGNNFTLFEGGKTICGSLFAINEKA
jgi:branched-chain amino acid transport system substrate-binding protein